MEEYLLANPNLTYESLHAKKFVELTGFERVNLDRIGQRLITRDQMVARYDELADRYGLEPLAQTNGDVFNMNNKILYDLITDLTIRITELENRNECRCCQ